jgi:hypothetical protein
MSDYAPEPVDEAPEEPIGESTTDAGDVAQEFSEPVRTGVEDVDAVLDSVDDLEGRPVDEHVATFESAHERLRGALDASSGDGSAG